MDISKYLHLFDYNQEYFIDCVSILNGGCLVAHAYIQPLQVVYLT